MQSLSKFNPKASRILRWVATGLLLVSVACGAAATATPRPADTPRPAVAQVATPTPTARPAAAPTLTSAPAVSPGKVTVMIAAFGAERFDNTFQNSGHDYARIIHAFYISSDVKEGRRVIIPGIATKWEMSGDGLTWTFTIRKGVKFHSGTELTAEDVLWTLQHTMGPQAKDYGSGPGSTSISHRMDRIEQTGPDQVSVTLKVPSPEFAQSLSDAGQGWVGVVYPKRATLHDLQEEAAYDKNPVGAGIMRLVKHVPADSMTFERFADYYHQPKNGFPTDKRVNFAVLDLRLIPEEATRVAGLRAGDADIVPISLASRKQVEAGGGRLVFGQEGGVLDVRTQGCWKPQFPCSDKRVRQALNYAIDKQVMQNQLYGGPDVMQVRGWNLVTPSSVGYRPGLDPFPFDPVKARQLLAEAGYPGGKGFGKLVINTWVSGALPLMPEAAQLGAEYWKRELGLDVQVKVGDESATKKASKLTEDLYGQIFWQDNETRLDYSPILRSQWGNPKAFARPHNDPELFDLAEKTLAELDPVKWEKGLISTYRRLRDEAYFISLGYINIPWAVGPRIRTWQPYPLGSYISALHTVTLK